MCLTSQYLATEYVYLVSLSLSILDRPDGLCLQDQSRPGTLHQVWKLPFNLSSSEPKILKPLPHHLNHLNPMLAEQDPTPTCLSNILVQNSMDPYLWWFLYTLSKPTNQRPFAYLLRTFCRIYYYSFDKLFWIYIDNHTIDRVLLLVWMFFIGLF
jgi:hypothetical protein